MGIDLNVYRQAAVKGDLSGPVIDMSIALTAINRSLQLLASGVPTEPKRAAEFAAKLNAEIEVIGSAASGLQTAFDQLTGWTEDQ